ncbi:hypothetical protein TWF718_003461 [Orbilia javanica]|uniref:Uncharacterized protein n=1 Tax=Orbilia javanica TaxID=47235 RepID=A0AAN8MSU8_9PEZI
MPPTTTLTTTITATIITTITTTTTGTTTTHSTTTTVNTVVSSTTTTVTPEPTTTTTDPKFPTFDDPSKFSWADDVEEWESARVEAPKSPIAWESGTNPLFPAVAAGGSSWADEVQEEEEAEREREREAGRGEKGEERRHSSGIVGRVLRPRR